MLALPKQSHFSKSYEVASKAIMDLRVDTLDDILYFWMLALPEQSQRSKSHKVASSVKLKLRDTLNVIFYVLDAWSAENSQNSKSSAIASEVILSSGRTLDDIFYDLDACSARAFSTRKVFRNCIQCDAGAQEIYWMSCSMLWMLAVSQHSRSWKSRTKIPKSFWSSGMASKALSTIIVL